MSLIRTACPAPSRRLPLALLAGVALVLALSACSSSNGDGDGTPVDVETIIDLIVGSGSGMRGAQVDLSFDASISLASVVPVGPFSGQACEENVGTNFARLLCARNDATTFNSPQTLWRLTFEHSSVVDPLDQVLGIDCLASDPTGNTFPVACSLE